MSKRRVRSDDCGSFSSKFQRMNDTIDFRKISSEITNVNDALTYLRSLIPIELISNNKPAIVWKHQLYAIIANRTLVDHQLELMCNNGKLRFFRLGSTLNANETAILLIDDYKNLVKNFCPKTIIIERFMNKVVTECSHSTFTSTELKSDYNFNDSNMNELLRNGLIAAHHSNIGSWLLSIPNAGEFMKSFLNGRKSVINFIKKSKFQEISKNELFKRKLPNDAKLGMEYHIYDLIGSDIIKCIETSTGTVYRIP